MCCGIVYAGRYGEVIIDPQLFKPCCRKMPKEVEERVEQKQEEVEQEVEQQQKQQQKVEQQKDMEAQEMKEEGHTEMARSSPLPQVQQEVSE